MKIKNHTISYGELELDDGRTVRLSYRDPYGYEPDPLVTIKDDGTIIVSYLITADSAHDMDPSKEDCTGWQEFRVVDSQRDADELSELLELPETQKALETGRAFLFEKYEHGQVRYALRGESSMVDRQWDVSPVAGFMWADDEWGPDTNMEEAARGFLETYTAWCNGEVYGVIRETFDADLNQLTDDSCWGYIGHQYAQEVMKEEHDG